MEVYGGMQSARFPLSSMEMAQVFFVVSLLSLAVALLSGSLLRRRRAFQSLPNWNGFLSGCVWAFFLDYLSTLSWDRAQDVYGIAAMFLCCAVFFRMSAKAQTTKQRLLFVSIIFAVFMLQLPAPQAPATEQEESSLPNVLLISIDALRAETFFESDIQQLHNIAFLRQNGIVFERVLSTSSERLQAYEGLLYGDLPKPRQTERSATRRSFAQRFQNYGYHTAAYWSTGDLFTKPQFQRGFAVVDNELSLFRGWSLGMWGRFFPLPATQRSAMSSMEYARDGLNPRDLPFLVWLHWAETQAPYLPPVEWGGHFYAGDPYEDHDPECVQKIDSRHHSRIAGRCNLEWIHAEYKAEIASLDRALGSVIQWVNETPNTLLVIVGGYGIHRTEQEPWFSAGGLPFEENLRVPLIFWFPSILPSQRYITRPISSADVMPTIFDIISLEVPAGIYGQSVIDVMYSGQERSNIFSIVNQQDMYVWDEQQKNWIQKK